MTVVIDVGAARHDEYFSMERLIEQFNPTLLYAYDPSSALAAPDYACGTTVILRRVAAWTYDGTVGYREAGAWSELTSDGDAQVPCIDLAKEIEKIYENHSDRLILKLDCEGAEYELLSHLIQQEADVLLDSILVEWHPWLKNGQEHVRARIESSARCEIREWWF